jgi:hypothetical protein
MVVIPVAAVIGSETTITGRQERPISFKEVCSRLGNRYTLMIEPIGKVKLSCTGKEVFIVASCPSRLDSGEWLLIGEVDSRKLKSARCIYGQDLRAVVECQELPPEICQHPKAGCISLQDRYAPALKVFHASVTKLQLKRSSKQTINCYYSK